MNFIQRQSLRKAKRNRHQKQMQNLMHKLGGRRTQAWYLIRLHQYKKVAIAIAHQKYTKLLRQQKITNLKAVEFQVSKVLAK